MWMSRRRQCESQIQQLDAELDKLSEGGDSFAGGGRETVRGLRRCSDSRDLHRAQGKGGGQYPAFSATFAGGYAAQPPWLLRTGRLAPSNPLTARVTVNRMWQEIFGTGIVETTEDFGVMGWPPGRVIRSCSTG